MASPQLENGYTSIANEILEALMRVNLSPYAWRVLLFIIRFTYGFQRKTDRISLSQFSRKIEIDRRLVHRALKDLQTRNLIVISRDDKNKVRYGFQKNYERWKLSSVEMTKPTVISRDDTLSSVEMTKVSSVEIPSKESTKESLSKENPLISPPANGGPPYREIISYLNDRTGKKFRAEIQATQKLIKTRWGEGFRLDDFRAVIDNQCTKWMRDPKMVDYLRPQTLFGNKFESYLNGRNRGNDDGKISSKDFGTGTPEDQIGWLPR